MSGFDLGPGDTMTEGVLTRRLLAWMLDVLVIGLLVLLAWLLIVAVGLLTFGFGFVLLAGLPAIGLCYHVVFVASPGAATPGQRMMDLVVCRETDFGPPSLLQAILFTAGLWFTLSFAFLLLAVAAFTPCKRALHDMAGGVVVLRNRALTHARASGNIAFGTLYR